jgi:uncharacterized protein
VAAPTDRPLTLAGPAGDLEALLSEGDAPPVGVAVVCHPHPQHEGTMHNKVAHTLARTFANRAIPALRFNFRGVGASGGAYDAGAGETDDALAAVDAMRARHPGVPVWLGGFSFGSFVALRAASRVDCRGLVLVAPPVQRFAFGQTVADCPVLVVQGDADDVVACDDVARWVDATTPRPRFERMAGVGHFFHGHLGELRAAVDGFIADA